MKGSKYAFKSGTLFDKDRIPIKDILPTRAVLPVVAFCTDVLSCQLRVTVTPCFVCKVIKDKIDRANVYKSYPQDRINTQVYYRFPLALVKCTR